MAAVLFFLCQPLFSLSFFKGWRSECRRVCLSKRRGARAQLKGGGDEGYSIGVCVEEESS